MKRLLSLLLALVPAAAVHAEPILYGTLSVSAASLREDNASRSRLGSDGSHLGLKDVTEVGDSARVLWQLEAGIDITGETSAFPVRDRFLGMESNYGQLLAGVRDTPFNDLRQKISVFEDTLGDSRGIIGAASGVGNLMDVRARNMVRYQSPRMINVLTGVLMYSTGNHDASAGGVDDQQYELTSVSLLARLGPIYGGAAWEHQSLPTDMGGDRSGMRLGARVRYAAFQVGALVERLRADDLAALSRDGYLVNVSRELGMGRLGVQWMAAAEHARQAHSGAAAFALGYGVELATKTSISVVLANLRNASNGGFSYYAVGEGAEPASGNPATAVTGISVTLAHRL